MQDQIQAVLRARETEKREAQQAVQEEQERRVRLQRVKISKCLKRRSMWKKMR